MMSRPMLSRKAHQRIPEIREYSRRMFGRERARKYMADLWKWLRELAKNPELGKSYEGSELRFFQVGSHVVFYRTAEYGILVVLILHERELPDDKL